MLNTVVSLFLFGVGAGDGKKNPAGAGKNRPGGKGGLVGRKGRGCSAGPRVCRRAALTPRRRHRSGGSGQGPPAIGPDPPPSNRSVNISVTGTV